MQEQMRFIKLFNLINTKQKCRCGGDWKYYNIGFDDGYQCQKCQQIVEVHEYIRLSDEK